MSGRARRRRERKLAARLAVANAPPRTPKHYRLRQLGSVGDVPALADRIDDVRPSALDIETPAFWRKVWDK